MNTKPDYGNWIRQKRVYTFIGIGLVLVLLAIIPVHPIIRLVLLLAGVMFLGLGSYLAYISRQFSERGGGYQRKLWNIVLDHLDWDGEGEVMDIGTGNGPLAIALAKRFPGARVTGIDYWGSDWEYSQNTCEQNAALEGVAERTEFRQASAASHRPLRAGLLCSRNSTYAIVTANRVRRIDTDPPRIIDRICEA